MRMYLREKAPDYARLAFPRCISATPEAPEEVERMYGLGFLPVSTPSGFEAPLFYHARSARVRLADFKWGSDEEYTRKKVVEDLGPIESIVLRTDHALKIWPGLPDLCLKSANDFASGAFSPERINFLLTRSVANMVAIHLDRSGSPVACVLLVVLESSWHAWFNFYCKRKNLGRFSLLRVVQLAKDAAGDLCYLGTIYGSKSRYKIMPGVEFFDENGWSTDLKSLKQRWATLDIQRTGEPVEPTKEEALLCRRAWLKLPLGRHETAVRNADVLESV